VACTQINFASHQSSELSITETVGALNLSEETIRRRLSVASFEHCDALAFGLIDSKTSNDCLAGECRLKAHRSGLRKQVLLHAGYNGMAPPNNCYAGYRGYPNRWHRRRCRRRRSCCADPDLTIRFPLPSFRDPSNWPVSGSNALMSPSPKMRMSLLNAGGGASGRVSCNSCGLASRFVGSVFMSGRSETQSRQRFQAATGLRATCNSCGERSRNVVPSLH